jgi:hypothetical protein
MKKFCIVLSFAVVMMAPNLFAAMSVILMYNTGSYSSSFSGGVVGGEFRGVGGGTTTNLDSIINWSAYASSTKGTVSSADSTSHGYSTSLNGQKYFQTFCIESTVYYKPGTSYSVAISQQSGQGTAITIGTAWLYSRFVAGTLSGYNYTYGSGRTASATLLQEAIWWLQGQTWGVKDSFITTAENALYGKNGSTQDALIKGKANGAYGVYALNLGNPDCVQDQLVVVVPEYSTIIAGALLLPFGASMLRILRRKKPMA